MYYYLGFAHRVSAHDQEACTWWERPAAAHGDSRGPDGEPLYWRAQACPALGAHAVGALGANATPLALGAIAHNLARWCAKLGDLTDQGGPIAPCMLRRRYIAVPDHLSRSGRRPKLHLVKGWPWEEALMAALGRLRALVPMLA